MNPLQVEQLHRWSPLLLLLVLLLLMLLLLLLLLLLPQLPLPCRTEPTAPAVHDACLQAWTPPPASCCGT